MSESIHWQSAGLCYLPASWYFRVQFGQRVWRIGLDAGAGCPNRDGTVGTGGCIFCNPASFSISRRESATSIEWQIQQGIDRLRKRYAAARFVAYFQPGTNTYAPVDRLAELWRQAISHPEVVGLIVGTRPDCLPDPVLDLMVQFAGQTWFQVELGLQTIHDRSLQWLNRGHDYGCFLDAVNRCHQRGLRVGVHVILGLPGESLSDMLATAAELARLHVSAVKLHNLYVVRETPLAELWAQGRVQLPDLATYAAHVVELLERLPPDCVVDRLSGDAPAEYLLAPDWCLDKQRVRRAVEAAFRRRNTRQGIRYVSKNR